MEIRELRIGNLVNVPRLGQSAFRIDIIEHLSKNHDKVGVSQPIAKGFPTHPLTLFLEDLQPIPLTEEILLKCGFEKIQSKEYPHSFIINKGMSNEVEIENLNQFKCFTFSHGNKFSCIRIDYIHQLQNLYFSLTGKELEINL